MPSHKTEPNVGRILVGGIGVLVVLLAATAGLWLEPTPRAWLLTGGFALLTASCVGATRSFLLPALIGLVLVVFCGLSATVAVPETIENAIPPPSGMVTQVSEAGFKYAALVTGLGGLAMLLGAIVAASFVSPPKQRRKRRASQIERTGQILVLIGFLGLAGAVLRFALTQFPVDDLSASFKSFWTGGSYLLLVATFAVPGFALWVQGLIGRGGSIRDYRLPVAAVILYVLMLLPSGQRVFLIALGLMLLAILIGNRVIGTRAVASILVAGVVLIGLSQALRNEVNETNRATIHGFAERAQPSQWASLFANQLASFKWTSLVAQNRERLGISNSFVSLLAKPIPRSIYPEKSQGFGEEFTKTLFPEAAEQDVYFATPAVAETDYNFGPIGVIAVMGLLGVFCVFVDRSIARRAPPLVEPVVVATIFWVAFELVRGDVANALVFSAGWVIPLLVFSRAIGLRDDPKIKRMVVDALQVAPKFSGIGRRVAEIGNSLKKQPLDVPIEVWCPSDVKEDLAGCFPDGTTFRNPIRSSRPRIKRIIVQNTYGPLRAGASTAMLSPGDQSPVWGRARSILTVHDVRRLARPESAVSGLEAWYYRKIMRIGAKRADYLLTISEFSKSELEQHLSFEAPVTIVSERPAAIDPVSIEDLSGNPPHVLVVGVLRKYKGLETLIAAIAKLGNTNDVRAIVVGGSEGNQKYVDELVALAKDNGVSEQIQIRGWISDKELRKSYRQVIATVNPSTYEGYGLAVAESIAAGIPTIASKIPPHCEIGGESVLYFEAGDPDGLAARIEELISNPAAVTEWARAARSRYQYLRNMNQPWASALAEAVDSFNEETRG